MENKTFDCSGCGNTVTKSAYVIAQMAMGQTMTYTCPDCQAKTRVPA